MFTIVLSLLLQLTTVSARGLVGIMVVSALVCDGQSVPFLWRRRGEERENESILQTQL